MTRLLYCECFKLIRSSSFLALVAATIILTTLTIITAYSPSGAGGPLFMVAGMELDKIGRAIGFIGNIIDPNHVSASAVRTAFVFTILWLPVVILFATGAFSSDFISRSLTISQAKGISQTRILISKAIVICTAVAVCYAISCTIAFFFKANQYGASPDFNALGVFFSALGLNILLLTALMTQVMCLFSLVRSPFACSLITVLISTFVLLAYPSSYSTLSEVRASGFLLYEFSPVFYLLHTCSLSIDTDFIALTIFYSLASILIALGISAVAMNRRKV